MQRNQSARGGQTKEGINCGAEAWSSGQHSIAPMASMSVA
jgi:hypothetical protein